MNLSAEQQALINLVADSVFQRWSSQQYFVQILQTLQPHISHMQQQQRQHVQQQPVQFTPVAQPGAPLVNVRRTTEDGMQVIQQTTTAQLLAELLDTNAEILLVLEEIRDRKKKI